MTAQDKARHTVWAEILNHRQGTRIPPRYELAGKAGVSEIVTSSVLAILKGQGVLDIRRGRPAIVKARIRRPGPGDLFTEILTDGEYSYVCLSCWHVIKPGEREAHTHGR